MSSTSEEVSRVLVKVFVEDEGLSGDRGLSVGERDFKESADFDERKSNRWSKVELHDGSEVRVAELILE